MTLRLAVMTMMILRLSSAFGFIFRQRVQVASDGAVPIRIAHHNQRLLCSYQRALFGSRRKQQTDEATGTTDRHQEAKLDTDKLPRLYVGAVPSKPRKIRNLQELLEPSSSSQQPAHPSIQEGIPTQLSSDQSHYVTSVLRLGRSRNKGSGRQQQPLVRIFDHQREEWLAELISTGNSRRDPVLAMPLSRILRREDGSASSRIRRRQSSSCCWLCVAPPKKKDRIKWMIEKTTELDCAGFFLLDSDRSERVPVRHDKLQSYAVEASEQCERGTVPDFVTLAVSTEDDDDTTDGTYPRITTKLSHLLQTFREQHHPQQQLDEDVKERWKVLICRERINAVPLLRAFRSMRDRGEQPDHVLFLFGPEGGWSPEEEDLMDELEELTTKASDSSFSTIQNVSLGSTILRTETAAMTAVAAFALYNDDQDIINPP